MQPQMHQSASVNSPRQLIAICGPKFHGKGTAASGLVTALGFVEINFADALKQACSAAFGIPMHYFTDPDIKEMSLAAFGYPDETPRKLLQYTGTELFRSRWDNIWINTWRLAAERHQRVVVSDMRFPNELAAVKDMGGLTIRVIRPSMLPSGDLHESERHAMTMSVDHTLVNAGTPAELSRNAVKLVGEHMGLL